MPGEHASVYTIDRWAYANRWRCRHPVEKLTLAAGMLLLSLTVPPWPGGMLILAVMAVTTVGLAGIPLRVYLRVLRVPAGFALTGAAAMLFRIAAKPEGGWRLALAPGGTAAAAAVLLRSLAALACLSFLALTTPVVEFVPLFRRWRLPPAVLDLVLLVYRFLHVLTDRARAARTAQASRLGHAGIRHAYRSLGLLAASLFPRALERARRLEHGLAARGFQGDLHVLLPQREISIAALAGILLLEIALGLLSAALGG